MDMDSISFNLIVLLKEYNILLTIIFTASLAVLSYLWIRLFIQSLCNLLCLVCTILKLAGLIFHSSHGMNQSDMNILPNIKQSVHILFYCLMFSEEEKAKNDDIVDTKFAYVEMDGKYVYMIVICSFTTKWL